jgi:hypothetical protein
MKERFLKDKKTEMANFFKKLMENFASYMTAILKTIIFTVKAFYMSTINKLKIK